MKLGDTVLENHKFTPSWISVVCYESPSRNNFTLISIICSHRISIPKNMVQLPRNLESSLVLCGSLKLTSKVVPFPSMREIAHSAATQHTFPVCFHVCWDAANWEVALILLPDLTFLEPYEQWAFSLVFQPINMVHATVVTVIDLQIKQRFIITTSLSLIFIVRPQLWHYCFIKLMRKNGKKI